MKTILYCAAFVFFATSVMAQGNVPPPPSAPPAQGAPAAPSAPPAQSPPAAPGAPAGGIAASLNKSLGMYVYPARGQDAATQEKDTQECYTWGTQQSGVDPLNPPDVKAAQTPKGPDGSAIKGAAKGAAAGAAIGAIAGDAGKGAAIGAAGGGMAGARGRRQRQQAQAQQAEKTAQAQEADLMNSFKKAYAACLTGKGYTVQ